MSLTFENVFRISSLALRFSGIHPNLDRDGRWVLRFAFFNVVSGSIIFFFANSIICYDVPYKNYTKAIKNASLLIVSLTIPYKNSLALYYKKELKNCIDMLNEDYAAIDRYTDEEKLLIKEYSAKAVSVCKLYFYSVLMSATIFPVKAFYLMLRSYLRGEFRLAHIYDITYPEALEKQKDVVYVYSCLFLISLFFTINGSWIFFGFDPLVSIFVLHVCGQIEILSRQLMCLTDLTNEKDILDKLKNINKKLQALYKFSKSLRSNFMEVFELQIKTTIFLSSFTLFQIVQSLYHFEINVEFAMMLFACTLHFFIGCYYGDFLMNKGMKLRESIYCCGWEKQPNIKIRKTVLLMLTRCNNPPSIRSVFYPVNLETFSEACRQSYAIFNIMNAAWS
nr:odorant receptor 10 [Papilio glaucus]